MAYDAVLDAENRASQLICKTDPYPWRELRLSSSRQAGLTRLAPVATPAPLAAETLPLRSNGTAAVGPAAVD